jgi:hypothetical protein
MTPTRREVVDEGRLANLRCALIALRIKQDEPELRRVHQLLDNWNGIGGSTSRDASITSLTRYPVVVVRSLQPRIPRRERRKAVRA